MRSQIGEYYLGLDIGTSSLGWAVTDPEYNIVELKRKALWGIHLFEEGQTAADRRIHRCARRRLNRRKQRIRLLQELFSEEIYKIDQSFFERLSESHLLEKDRSSKQKNSLFNDADFKDVDYFVRFPTIYHLRKYLIQTDQKPDIRLLYLAIHHIIKYRGHFLFSNISDDKIPDFGDIFSALLSDVEKYGISLVISDEQKMVELLTNRTMGSKEKKKALSGLMGCNGSREKELAALLSGGKVNLGKLFDDQELDDESISFKDASIEKDMLELEEKIDIDYMNTIRISKQLFDWSILKSLLKGFDSISSVKISLYEKHKKDLKLLKKAVRKYAPDKYKEVFKSENIENNYCSYVGTCSGRIVKDRCNQIDFCEYCSSIFKGKNIETDVEFKTMLEELDNNSFMPKQISKDNSVFPYQVHRRELKLILENMSRFFPFLEKIGDDGYTIKKKVLLLNEFRIPYYVGPLDDRAENAWLIRKSNETVTPWNFDKVVDMDLSSEKFIDNLTNFCSYLVGEKVLPKNSILYSYYSLHNELNNLKINGTKISVSLKKRMVDDLFVKQSVRVTQDRIRKYLISIGEIEKSDPLEITGIDGDVKSNLRSLHTLKKIIGDKVEDRRLCEDIVRIVTVFGDEKRIHFSLMKNHADALSEEEIKKLSKIKFEGWGRLSEKFLTGLYDEDNETGLRMNIMGLLENTQDNLMDVYHKYSIKKQVDKHNFSQTSDFEMSYDFVDKMYISPAVKRSVWRTVSVVRDVVKKIGHFPKKVFVETTRTNLEPSKKKRFDSRKKQLLDLYNSCKEDPDLISSLDSQEESKMKSRSLYLYYTQRGRCMYCGKKIDLNDFNNKEVVDRDHIYPQSKIKDDSIHNNLVLTCRKCNSDKLDEYPLPPEVQNKMAGFWKDILDRGYITKEKYSRLVRTDRFTDAELDKFISRQLVETSQSVNAVIDVLKRLFNNESDIVYVKSGLVSEFRQSFGMIKCRGANDLHHAKDAYLNIVAGNVYDVKFTKNISNFIKSGETYNLRRIYDFTVKRNGVTAWNPGETGSISTVKRFIRRDNVLFTSYSYINKGLLFDQNPIKKSNKLYPRKADLSPDEYGGYDNVKGACYSLVEYVNRGKTIRSLEVVPVHSIGLIKNEQKLSEYYDNLLGVKTKIIVPVIKMNSLFEWDGFRMNIGGRTGNNIVYYPAVQPLYPDKIYEYLKKVTSYNDDYINRSQKPISYYNLSAENNVMLYDYFRDKSSKEPYSKILLNLSNYLVEYRQKFENMDIGSQALQLIQLSNSFKCDKTVTNMSKIGGPGLTGRIVFSKKLPSKDKVVSIIHQSPSGLDEQRIRLN